MSKKIKAKIVAGVMTVMVVMSLTGCDNPIDTIMGNSEKDKVVSIIDDRKAVGEYLWKQGKVELGDTGQDIGTVKIDNKHRIWLNRENLCKSVNKEDNTIYKCRDASYQIVVEENKVTIAMYDEEEHQFPTDDNKKAVFTK